MYKTEYDYLSDLLLENGEPNSELSTLFNNISLIGKQVVSSDGSIRLHNSVQERFDGITDTKGNYMYIRFNGQKTLRNRLVNTPLRAVIVLMNRKDIDTVAANMVYYFNRKPQFQNFSFETNTFRVFIEEKGLKIEDLKQEIYLAYIDFDCIYGLPTCFNITQN